MSSGILYGLSAYVLWGMFPLFFKQLQAASAIEVVLHRMVWSLVFVLIVLAVLRRWNWLGDVRRSPALVGKFAVSALLLAGNWLSYVWAVNNGHVLDASLGYFILPLINVALGFIFLHERPRKAQWAAFALAATGVQHVGHGRVHPFHRGAGTRGAVCSAVGKLAAHGAGIAKPCKGLADLLAREAAVVLHAGAPIGGPAQRGDQFARQAKGQVKPAHPGLGLGQPLGQSRQGLDALQPQQLHARTIAAAQCQHDGFAAAGAAGEIAAD